MRGLVVAPVAVLAILVIAGQLRPAAPPPLRVELPQPTLVPTALPTAAATVPALPTVAPPTTNAAGSATALPTLFPPELLDTQFDTRQTNWPENPPYATWSAGAYRLAARDQGHFVALAAPIAEVPPDVEVRARFQKTGGPAGGGYGIILRDQSNPTLNGVQQGGSYYVLELDDRGEVGAWRRDEDQWIELMPWTRTGVDRPANAVTDLQARAAGDVLALSADGSQILQVQDRTLASGGVGVFVGGDGNQVALLALSITKAD
jgi:hypothetical protein